LTHLWSFNNQDSTFTAHLKRKTKGWVITWLSANRPHSSRDVTAAAEKKLKAAILEVVNEWADTRPPALAAGELAEARNAIADLEEETAKLRGQIMDKEARIGWLYLRYVSAQTGRPMPVAESPSDAALRIYRHSQNVANEAAGLLDVHPDRIRRWGDGSTVMTFSEERAVVAVAQQLLGPPTNPPRRRRRRRR
jgi:hypothetical protein